MSDRQHGDSSSPPAAAPPVSAATNAQAKALLVANSVYDGIVSGIDANGAYSVDCTSPRCTIHGCRLASPVIGGLMGFNVRTVLQSGTKVVFVYGKPSVIFAALTADRLDYPNGTDRAVVAGPAVNENTPTDEPKDLLSGELEIANLFGVAIELLTTMARVGAGDLARIECHLINDMVRIIAAQFRQFSGVGEYLEFDHGRPTAERTWSSYRHEIMGRMKEGEQVMELLGDEADWDKLDADRFTAVGRYRMLELFCFAGDFIHSFISDPPATLAKLAARTDTNDFQSGKSWIHRNSDGSLLIQSVADIRLERVVRIPVIKRIANHEDPAVTTARGYDNLASTDDMRKLLRIPDFGALDQKNSYRFAYQIRVYSRWLSRVHSVARALQLTKDYAVPSERQTPVPSWTNHEQDKVAANDGVDNYIDTYACIAIMRDGSVVVHDGYGSSIVMSDGKVQISASRHIELEAAGDFIVKAGGSIYLKARRNLELSAALGGVIVSSYAWFKLLCEKGTMWLRSMADGSTAAKSGTDGPEAEFVGRGVLIEATGAGAAIRSNQQLALLVDGAPASPGGIGASDCDIIFKTRGNVRCDGANVITTSSGSVTLHADKAIGIHTSKIYSSASSLSLDGGRLSYASGVLTTQEARALTTRSNTILGGAMGATRDDNAVGSLVPHHNHVGLLSETDKVKLVRPTDTDALAALSYAGKRYDNAAAPLWSSASEGPRWSFPPASEYVWDVRDETVGSTPETLTQQYLRIDLQGSLDPWGGPGYQTWDMSGDTITGIRMPEAGTVGYGALTHTYTSDDGSNLREPQDHPPKEYSAGWTLSTSPGIRLCILNRQPPATS